MKHDTDNVHYIDMRSDKQFKDPIEGCKFITQNIDNAIADKEEPVLFTIGGDHTISYGSVSSSLKMDPNTVLIWIDAHSDINSPETSCSGNCHGMPVNYILGLTRHKAIGETPKLNPRNLIYMGLRSTDAPEEEILQSLEKKGMLRFSADYIR